LSFLEMIIFGDDIGYWNIGAYTHGMMGRTPNIDSIAKDLFWHIIGLFAVHAFPNAMANRLLVTGRMLLNTRVHFSNEKHTVKYFRPIFLLLR
jgi:hypothetical protein